MNAFVITMSIFAIYAMSNNKIKFFVANIFFDKLFSK